MKLHYKIFLMLTLFFLPKAHAMTPLQMKGLYNVLLPQYSYLSPVHGANWWENKIAENMYKFGDGKDETIKLVKQLFYLLDNAFYPTRGTIQPATYFTVDTIGKLIVEMVKYDPIITNVKKQKDLQESLKAIIKQAIPTNTKVDSDKIKELAKSMVISLLEQKSTKEKPAKYIPYTPHAVLLTFMWAKAPTKKDVIENYLKTVHKELKALIIPEGVKLDTFFEELLSSKFNESQLDDFWNLLINGKESINPNTYEVATAVASLREFKSQVYPPIFEWRRVTYDSFFFPDCGETSARLFLNILTYDQEKQIFDITKLTRNNYLKIPKTVIEFYTKYPNVSDANKVSQESGVTKEIKDPFQDWGILIQNLPGITYANAGVCELEAGLGNMLKVLNYLLLGNDKEFLKKTKEEQLDYLAKVLSSETFKISWKVKNNENEVVNNKDVDLTLIFTVIAGNNIYDFEWAFNKGHFEIFIQASEGSQTFNAAIIKQLFSQITDPQLTMISVSSTGKYLNFDWTSYSLKKLLSTLPPEIIRTTIFPFLKNRGYTPENILYLVTILLAFPEQKFNSELIKIISYFSEGNSYFLSQSITLLKMHNNNPVLAQVIAPIITQLKERQNNGQLIDILGKIYAMPKQSDAIRTIVTYFANAVFKDTTILDRFLSLIIDDVKLMNISDHEPLILSNLLALKNNSTPEVKTIQFLLDLVALASNNFEFVNREGLENRITQKIDEFIETQNVEFITVTLKYLAKAYLNADATTQPIIINALKKIATFSGDLTLDRRIMLNTLNIIADEHIKDLYFLVPLLLTPLTEITQITFLEEHLLNKDMLTAETLKTILNKLKDEDKIEIFKTNLQKKPEVIVTDYTTRSGFRMEEISDDEKETIFKNYERLIPLLPLINDVPKREALRQQIEAHIQTITFKESDKYTKEFINEMQQQRNAERKSSSKQEE